MDNILEIVNLTKKYPDFTLDTLSFAIPQGTIMGLIGENGAGKTTTMNLILNQMKKDGGTINIFGKDNLEHEKAVKEKIGVVFDECHFPESFTANEMELFMTR